MAIESYELLLHTSSTHIALTADGKPVVGYYNLKDDYYYLAFKRDGEWIKKKSPYSYMAKNIPA